MPYKGEAKRAVSNESCVVENQRQRRLLMFRRRVNQMGLLYETECIRISATHKIKIVWPHQKTTASIAL